MCPAAIGTSAALSNHGRVATRMMARTVPMAVANPTVSTTRWEPADKPHQRFTQAGSSRSASNSAPPTRTATSAGRPVMAGTAASPARMLVRRQRPPTSRRGGERRAIRVE